MGNLKTLFIFLRWPEPNSSAAGWRMTQILEAMREASGQIIVASTADKTEFSNDLAMADRQHAIVVNDSRFDGFISDLKPDIVIFDRFITEEQFGWRVAKHAPDAVRILDTEDLHFLRAAREQSMKSDFAELDLDTEDCYREIASIMRSDLSLIISQAEVTFLKDYFQVPSSRLHYLPFLNNQLDEKEPDFDVRDGFMFIGNFLHNPNADAVRVLKENLWPLIRKELPNVELRVFGAYMDEHWQGLHDPANGFLMMGRAEDAMQEIANAKVLLAPLRFGAGLKGKLFQAMQCDTPFVTTSVGLEGLFDDRLASNQVPDWTNLAAQAVMLHNEKTLWLAQVQQGRNLLKERFGVEPHRSEFLHRIEDLRGGLNQHRKLVGTSNMLNYHSFRGAQFMSRWIEEKNS